VLTCAWLEGGHTYRSLAEGNAIPRETCRRYIAEGIKVLARWALPLTEVVRLAVKAGWPYLIVDGVNVPTERIKAEYTKKQHWYSGKHHRHGTNVQTVAAPDGELLWVSGVLPGRTVDITAARRFKIADKVLQFWACWPIWATSVCTRVDRRVQAPTRGEDSAARAQGRQHHHRQPARDRGTRQRPTETVQGLGLRLPRQPHPDHPRGQGRPDPAVLDPGPVRHHDTVT
jgi:hypothetical protein